jgi:hypothetical protein
VNGDLIEQGQRLFRLLDIKARNRETGVHDNVLTDRDLIEERDRYASANPADFDLNPLFTQQSDDLNWDGQAHRSEA